MRVREVISSGRLDEEVEMREGKARLRRKKEGGRQSEEKQFQRRAHFQLWSLSFVFWICQKVASSYT